MGPKKRTAKRASKSARQLSAKPKYSLSSVLEHQIAFNEESMSNESSETDDKEVEVLIHCQPVFYHNLPLLSQSLQQGFQPILSSIAPKVATFSTSPPPPRSSRPAPGTSTIGHSTPNKIRVRLLHPSSLVYHAELDKLFTTSHPFFYGSLDLDGKEDLRGAFDSAYHQVESTLIERITEEAERWLRTPASSAYYDGYHLSTYVISLGFVPHLLIEQMD